MVDRSETWNGVERRSGRDRRRGNERRGEARTIYDRRSGLDRRGHPLYLHLSKRPGETPDSMSGNSLNSRSPQA